MMSKKKSIFQPSKALFGFQSLLGACGIAVCSALDWSPGSHYLANIVGLILSCLIMLVGFGLFLTLQTMTKLPSNNPSSFGGARNHAPGGDGLHGVPGVDGEDLPGDKDTPRAQGQGE